MTRNSEFSPKDVESLLVACHRRCCVCHKFCGVKIELDHIKPKGDGGSNDIANAVPLCFDCHAEVHHYNDRHPRGRKFTERELRHHKEQWLRLCGEMPQALVDAPRFQNPGPLEAVLWELHLDRDIAIRAKGKSLGCPFEIAGIKAAIGTGALLGLPDDVSTAVRSAYVAMGAANALTGSLGSIGHTGQYANAVNRALDAIKPAHEAIDAAIKQLEEL
jgi:hypothetical protein